MVKSPQAASQAAVPVPQVASAIPQVDNKSAASQSEADHQVQSDAQDAEDRAVQVSHTQDPLVALQEVSAKSQVDNKSAVSQSVADHQALSDVQEIPAATQSDVQGVAALACLPHNQDPPVPTQCP